MPPAMFPFVPKSPRGMREANKPGWVVTGSAAWTLVEYLLHRHLPHALRPFKHWHALHHPRANAWLSRRRRLHAEHHRAQGA